MIKDYTDWAKQFIKWQIIYRWHLNKKYLKEFRKNHRINYKKSKNGNLNQISISLRYKGFSRYTHKKIFGKYRKIFLITMNHSNAGFFTYLLFALNQLDYCKENNYFPVVYYGKDSTNGDNAYFDSKYGHNMWDYYFEPVSKYSYDHIIKMLEDPDHEINKEDIIKLDNKALWYLHKYNPRSIYAYPYGIYKYKLSYDKKWYDKNRIRAHHLIKKHIKIKEHILNEIGKFYEHHMKDKHVIGIHIRGTDKGSAKATAKTMKVIEPISYIKEIDKYSMNYPNSKIFVATDQEQYLELLKENYGTRIISYPAIRSTSKLAPFQIKDLNNYRKGKDVLIECLLLSKCQFFLKCTSTVGEAALWFNPYLENIDMNYLY